MTTTTLAAPLLTVRQEQICALLAKGYSNPAIATELGLSRNTVKTYVQVVLDKFGATNRTQVAVAYKDAIQAKAALPLWRVMLVQTSSSGDHSETPLFVRAETPAQALAAARELPGAPKESDTCHYSTPREHVSCQPGCRCGRARTAAELAVVS